MFLLDIRLLNSPRLQGILERGLVGEIHGFNFKKSFLLALLPFPRICAIFSNIYYTLSQSMRRAAGCCINKKCDLNFLTPCSHSRPSPCSWVVFAITLHHLVSLLMSRIVSGHCFFYFGLWLFWCTLSSSFIEFILLTKLKTPVPRRAFSTASVKKGLFILIYLDMFKIGQSVKQGLLV